MNLKILIDSDLKSRLDTLLERKKITLTATMESLIAWFVEQDSLLQAMLLGQVDTKDKADILKIVIARMAKEFPGFDELIAHDFEEGNVTRDVRERASKNR